MFFTECANIAERHPDLAGVIQRIDAQLQEMRTAEVLRVGDFASFLGVDPNQVTSVFEMLVEGGLLVGEEMVECPHCSMAVLRSDYDSAVEKDGEFRCSDCDRPLPQTALQAITTYRCGEQWQEYEQALRASDTSQEEEKDASVIGLAESYPEDVRILQKQGATWLAVYEGIPKSIPDSNGVSYIAYLLRQPGQEVHAWKLRSDVQGDGRDVSAGSAGDVLDGQALQDYKDRITEIDEELAEAEANNDLSRKDVLTEERAALYAEVGSATGLGGRNRKAADDRERHRQAVSVAIHRALRAIKKKKHEPLWQHLKNAVNIGEFLSYTPDQATSWTIQT